MNDLQNQSTRVLNKINTTTYLDLLRENLLTEMNLYEIFQQDNAPAHKLEQTMTWFLENGVELLENWLSCRILILLETCGVKLQEQCTSDLPKI